MKKKELIALYNGLNSVGNLVGVFFGYAVNRNIEKMRPEIEALQKAVAPSKEFTEYDVKRVEIVKKYAKKDDKGEFVIKENQYDVGDNKDVVENEVNALKEENKAVVEAHEKQMEEYNALLERDSTVELYKVKLENVPKEITASQMAAVFAIVEE